MAIRFACQCGKPLQSREDFAGRKMRCPACGAILTIPNAGGGQVQIVSALETTPMPPPPSPRGTMIPERPATLTPPAPPSRPPSSPGEGPLVYAEEEQDAPGPAPAPDQAISAGGPGQDVAPQTAETLDLPAQRVQKKPAPRKVSRPVNIWLDRSLRQEIAPWPASARERVGAIQEDQQRGGRGRWLLALVLLLLLAGGAFGWVFRDDIGKALDANVHDAQERALDAQERSQLRKLGVAWADHRSLDLLPKNAPSLVSVRTAEVWKQADQSNLSDDTRKKLEKWEVMVKWYFGLPPDQVERVTVLWEESFLGDPKKVEPKMYMVETVEPYDKDSFLPEWSRWVGYVGMEAGYYRLGTKAVAFVNDQMFVIGSEADIKAFIKQPPPPKGTQTPQTKLLQKYPVVAHQAVTPEAVKQALAGSLSPGPALEKIRSVDVALDLNQKPSLDIFMHFADEQQATAAKGALEKTKGLLNFLPLPLDAVKKNPILGLAKSVLTGAHLQTQQETLLLRCPVDEAALVLMLDVAEKFHPPPPAPKIAPPMGMGGGKM
jgi:hypothetical protein